MQHYRCYEIHVQKTLAKRIADTVTFLPHNMSMPDRISKEAALDKIHDLIKLLKSNPPHHPLASNHDDTITALDKLNDIFHKRGESSQTHVPTLNKPKPNLHNDWQSPRVPLKTNNEAPRVNEPTGSNNPTQQCTNANPSSHNYFTRSKVAMPAT